ncbi:MAG TPA: hypothetical protein VMU78_01235 [Methylocella sp.]|nr:hypothetical protein [Methylocella sp.]
MGNQSCRIPHFNAVSEAYPLGILFIDFETRRRFRVNGIGTEMSTSSLRLRVVEALPKCPKYIHRHVMAPLPATPSSMDITHGNGLTDDLTA